MSRIINRDIFLRFIILGLNETQTDCVALVDQGVSY